MFRQRPRVIGGELCGLQRGIQTLEVRHGGLLADRPVGAIVPEYALKSPLSIAD
jgi:hypothetical protein